MVGPPGKEAFGRFGAAWLGAMLLDPNSLCYAKPGMFPLTRRKQPSNLVTDPDALAKLLEMELALKRAGWERARSRRNIWRALSFLFLLLVIVGGLVAWFYFAPALRHRG